MLCTAHRASGARIWCNAAAAALVLVHADQMVPAVGGGLIKPGVLWSNANERPSVSRDYLHDGSHDSGRTSLARPRPLTSEARLPVREKLPVLCST